MSLQLFLSGIGKPSSAAPRPSSSEARSHPSDHRMVARVSPLVAHRAGTSPGAITLVTGARSAVPSLSLGESDRLPHMLRKSGSTHGKPRYQ